MTKTDAVQKLLNFVLGQVGVREGANNRNPYADDPRLQELYGWYAQNQPWCDLFTDEAFIECFGLELGAAMTYQPIGNGSAACRTSAQFFKNNGAWFSIPEIGDVIFFYYNGAINHQGIVVSISGGIVSTVEGNSSDMVRHNSYTIGSPVIAGYGRPKWDLVSDEDAYIDHTDSASQADAVIDCGADTMVNSATLRIGSTGHDVEALQRQLIQLGYNLGIYGADGDFGKDTLFAVKQFQADNGLVADGIVGEKTKQAIRNSLSKLTAKKPLLKYGAKGSYVEDLQAALITKGYPCGQAGIDGEFGKDTLYAVKAFQRDHGLEVDGVVGPNTWAALTE